MSSIEDLDCESSLQNLTFSNCEISVGYRNTFGHTVLTKRHPEVKSILREILSQNPNIARICVVFSNLIFKHVADKVLIDDDVWELHNMIHQYSSNLKYLDSLPLHDKEEYGSSLLSSFRKISSRMLS